MAKPTETLSRNTSTVVPASAVMLRVGVVSLVSVSAPEPLLSLKPVTVGWLGAVVSTVTANADDAVLTFPARSV